MLEQANGALVRERFVIRAIGRDRVEVIDDRQDPRANRNVFTADALRIALAIPPFVMAQDEGRNRIGERHGGDNLGADLRMNPDLLELLLGERPGLRQDVLRHGELADVVKQRRRLDALDVLFRESDGFREPGRVRLHAADVRLRRLVLGVDRASQRFDRGEVKIRGLLHVPLLIFDAAHVDLVGVIRQVERRKEERHQPPVRRVRHEGRGRLRRQRADEVARRAPQEIRLPHRPHALPLRERDGRRNQAGI